jgi:hypothetical protein
MCLRTRFKNKMNKKKISSWNMHTCIWATILKNKFWNFLVFSQFCFWSLLEQLIRRPISKTAWKFVQWVVFYGTFKLKNMGFSKLWAGIARAKALMEFKYFTLFIPSGSTIDMKNFKTIGESHIGPSPRQFDSYFSVFSPNLFLSNQVHIQYIHT